MKNIYLLYLPYLDQNSLLEGKSNDYNEFGQQVVDQIWKDIISIPWGHHTILIDKHLGHPEKALFYVRQTIENGWSRNVLLNFIGTGLYERQGKALSVLDLFALSIHPFSLA